MQGADCPVVRERATQVHQRFTQLIEETDELESTGDGIVAAILHLCNTLCCAVARSAIYRTKLIVWAYD